MAERHPSTVFRKKTLDRIASPEQLTDYLCVTNPGISLVLYEVKKEFIINRLYLIY